MKKNGKGFILGLTGGIACGKSTVAKMFEKLGAPMIDFDQLAREAVLPGSRALSNITRIFTQEVLQPSGELDRKKLSDIVFRDPEKRQLLESILYPDIFRLYEKKLDAIRKQRPNAIIQAVIPLLIEKNLRNRVDTVLLVYIPREMQIQRLMVRDGIDRTAAKRIIQSQMPIDEKKAYADYIISNEGSVSETEKRVNHIWNMWNKPVRSRNS